MKHGDINVEILFQATAQKPLDLLLVMGVRVVGDNLNQQVSRRGRKGCVENIIRMIFGSIRVNLDIM